MSPREAFADRRSNPTRSAGGGEAMPAGRHSEVRSASPVFLGHRAETPRRTPRIPLRREKGASHHLPVAEGDTAPAGGRGLGTNGGWHLFPG